MKTAAFIFHWKIIEFTIIIKSNTNTQPIIKLWMLYLIMPNDIITTPIYIVLVRSIIVVIIVIILIHVDWWISLSHWLFTMFSDVRWWFDLLVTAPPPFFFFFFWHTIFVVATSEAKIGYFTHSISHQQNIAPMQQSLKKEIPSTNRWAALNGRQKEEGEKEIVSERDRGKEGEKDKKNRCQIVKIL